MKWTSKSRTRTKATVETVAQRTRKNPFRKQKIIAREMKIPPRTMSRMIKGDLHCHRSAVDRNFTSN